MYIYNCIMYAPGHNLPLFSIQMSVSGYYQGQKGSNASPRKPRRNTNVPMAVSMLLSLPRGLQGLPDKSDTRKRAIHLRIAADAQRDRTPACGESNANGSNAHQSHPPSPTETAQVKAPSSGRAVTPQQTPRPVRSRFAPSACSS